MNVHGIIVEGDSIFDIKHVTQYLGKAFKVKDLGDLKYFPGLKITINLANAYLFHRGSMLSIFSLIPGFSLQNLTSL